MNLKRSVIALAIICYCVDFSHAQSPMASPKSEDLIDLMHSSGYSNIEDSFKNSNAQSVVESYVRFGNPSVETKWKEGDQFDKIDLKKTLSAHVAEIKSKTLVLNKFRQKVLERGNIENEGIYVEIELPFRIRSSKPFFEDRKGFSGNIKSISVSEIDPYRVFYLKKDETLSECSFLDAQEVMKNDGFIYHPEVGKSSITININDKLEVMRDIAKSTGSYILNIEFTDLRIERPREWGFYKAKAYKDSNMNCEKLRSNVLQTFKIVAPDYFVSHSAFDSNAEKRSPEIVIASVISIKVCKPDGTAIGSYLNKK
jgi:hypothetical protein